MKLLLCGGGTAGHINPAVAIAEEMLKLYPKSEILFIGRENGPENDIIVKSGFKLRTIKIEGLRRSISADNIRRIKNALGAVSSAKKIIREFRPDIILGTGGYVCWPVITAGRSLNIPDAIHESNITPGLTTRILAKKCNIVFLNHEESRKSLKKAKRVITVGNPLRQDFSKVDRNTARRKLGISDDKFFILSFGGSIGAEIINETCLAIMKNYSAKDRTVKHVHATGKRYFEKVNSKYAKGEIDGCQIKSYIDDMPLMLTAADVVICRCGAMTLSELSAAGVASILIPSPNVSDNHQYANGKLLCDIGAATLIEEKNLSEKVLTDQIIRLKTDKNARKKQAKNIKQLYTPNAAKNIINNIISLKNTK